MPRWLSTTLIVIAAVLIAAAFIANTDRPAPKTDPATAPTSNSSTTTPPDPSAAAPTPPPPAGGEQPTAATPDSAAPQPIAGLHVIKVDRQPEPEIGSTDPNAATNAFVLKARFTPFGAAVRHIELARYFSQVDRKTPLPVVQARIVERDAVTDGYSVYPLAAWQIVVNGGAPVVLANERWTAGEPVDGPGGARSVTFTVTIADAAEKPVLRIDRTWRITPGRYDLRVSNTIVNLTAAPLDVRLDQLGPIDLVDDGGYLGDRRTVVIGYLKPGAAATSPKVATTEGHHLPRPELLKATTAAVFPAADEDPQHELLWAATTNRYFTVVTHAPIEPDQPTATPIGGDVRAIHRIQWGPGGKDTTHTTLGLLYTGATRRINPAPESEPVATTAAQHTEALDVYAGPLNPDVLKHQPEYASLKMSELIVYNLGGVCAFCTFDWLAVALLNFLKGVHWLVRDWGLAIIILVAIVRTILHPLTKRSQVNMMKMGKQMQQLQPEVERIKTKHADNKEKLNAEMMKLYKERGVNPAAMGLGCLPMFLQMPIWFALYAMLYFAIELRHEPAFYSVFQLVSGGHWPFLADLSTKDYFIPLPEAIHVTLPAIGLLDSINILPILMALVFYLQQKYTMAATPPANEQIAQQQKMMKWMVLLFPVFLYNAPCGLTLYILTSTAVGIVESKRVRDHLKELEESGKLFEKKQTKPGGFMDKLAKAVEAKQRSVMEKKGIQPPTNGASGGGPSGGGKKNKPRGKGGQRY